MTLIEKLVKEIASIAPVDLEKVRIHTKTVTYNVLALCNMIEKGMIRISPELQRAYVWDDVRASLFIESLIYRLPIPPIILASFENALYVVDGVQRLTTIRRFINDELRLVGVSPKLRNKRYKTLDRKERMAFENAELPVIIFEVEGPPELKMLTYVEAFRRINLGAKPMSLMHVLFCTIPTPNNLLIKDVARSEEFRKLFEPSEAEVRDCRDLYVSLALHMAFLRKEPLNLIGSFRQRYIRDIVDTLFRPDLIEPLQDASRGVKASIRLALNLGLDKTVFIASTYTGAPPKRMLVNPVLAQVILLALYEVADKKTSGQELVLEFPVEKKGEFKKMLIDSIRKIKIDGKDFKTYWTEIVKNGRVELLRKFYEEVKKVLTLLKAS